MIAFWVFDYSKVFEQRRVWVRLVKETAHQLGTPLSSLMACVEYFRGHDKLESIDIEMIAEMEKDVERLEMVTSRFSNIGSTPVLKKTNVYELMKEEISYLKRRISNKVSFTFVSFPSKNYRSKYQ